MDLSITIALDGRDRASDLRRCRRMRRITTKVLESLLKFYRQLVIRFRVRKSKHYIARLIALASLPAIQDHAQLFTICKEKQQIKQYDQNLKTQYRDIYDSNINKAVSLLRKTQYHTYYLVNLMVRSMCR